MRTRETWRNEQSSLARAHPNPFTDGPRWELTGTMATLRVGPDLATATGAPPAVPMLLTGGFGNGAPVTLRAIAERAAGEMWAVAACCARPGRALFGAVNDALDDAVEAIVRQRGGGVGAARMRTMVEELRTVDATGDPRWAEILGDLVRDASEARWGLLICVEDLHAATRAESEAFLRSISTLVRFGEAGAGALRAVATTTSSACVGLDPVSRGWWTDVPLVTTREHLSVLGSVAARLGRTFTPDGLDAVHDRSGGVAELALAYAAGTWDATTDPAMTERSVAIAADRIDREWVSRLRSEWSARLTLGQRRYLRALADRRTSDHDLDDLHRRVGEATRYALSPAMLDAVLTTLVHEGVVIVADGRASIAVPGLERIL